MGHPSSQVSSNTQQIPSHELFQTSTHTQRGRFKISYVPQGYS